MIMGVICNISNMVLFKAIIIIIFITYSLRYFNVPNFFIAYEVM
jgi:hypothetical protein